MNEILIYCLKYKKLIISATIAQNISLKLLTCAFFMREDQISSSMNFLFVTVN